MIVIWVKAQETVYEMQIHVFKVDGRYSNICLK